MSSNDELSGDPSSSCDVESLQLALEEKGSFNSTFQRYRVGVVEEGDVTEEDVDDDDGLRFVTLESLDSKTRKQS